VDAAKVDGVAVTLVYRQGRLARPLAAVMG
jgi:NAD-dependent DNA ligase